MSPDDEDEMVMVCAGEHAAHSVDSALITADCGHGVWISASGVAMLTDYPQMTTRCLPCGGGYSKMAALAREGTAFIPPGAMKNIAKALGPEQAKDIEDWAHGLGLKDHPDD